MAEPESHQDGGTVERSDIHPRRIAAVAAFILLALGMVAGSVWGLLSLWGLPAGAGAAAMPDFLPEAPRLQSAPQDERAAYVAEKAKLLHSYGWVDRQAGRARIPIEVAMEILAAKGRERP